MNPKSIEKGIRIFPNITDELPILINGDMVTIDFPNDLDKNQTYVINLSRNIMDEHGVELADAIFLAYSTGKNISKGSISGIVYGEGKSAVHLWKIKDNSNFQDIVFTDPPNYITDVSNKGLFDFQYLSKGDYFIFTTLSGTGIDIRDLWENSNAISPPQHLNFFNPFSIKIFLEKNNFKICKLITPGVLDVSILENNFELIKSNFLKMFLKYSTQNEKNNFQNFLISSKNSSHLMVFSKINI